MTIIEALVVTLGLDASGFTRASQQAIEVTKKFKDDTVRAATDVERNAKRMQEAFGGVERAVMRLGTVFLGFAGGVGFVTFLANVQKSIAELYRLGQQLGQSGRDLYAWQQVGAQVGATAEQITGSYQKMVESINDYMAGSGQLNAYFRWFANQGVRFTNPDGSVRSQTELYTDINRAANQIQDPQRRATFLRGLGFDQGTVQMLMQNPEKLAADLASFRRNAPSPEEMKEAAIAQARFNAAWSETLRLSVKLGNIALPLVNTAMTNLAKSMEADLKTVRELEQAFDRFDKWFSGTWIGRMAAKILGEPVSKGNTPGTFDQRFGTFEYQPGMGNRPGGFRPRDTSGSSGGSGSDSGAQQSVAPGASIQGNDYLRQQRASRIAEINGDPVLKENVLKMLQLEEGSVGGKTAAMEALLNRSIMTGNTIKQELFSGFYGPVNRGGLRAPLSDAARRTSEQALANAAGGSNSILGRTDQGMAGDPNAGGPGRVRVPGTTGIFNFWKGTRGGRTFTHEDSARFAENLNRMAQESAMRHPTAAGMPGGGLFGGAASFDDRFGSWGNNLRATPWLQPNGMNIIKGIPMPTTNNSSTSETHIGQFTVNTESRSSPWGIANQIKEAVQRSNIMDNSNSGPN